MSNFKVTSSGGTEKLLPYSDDGGNVIKEIERALISSGAMRLPAMRLNNVAPALLKRIERYSEELEFLKDSYLYGSDLGSPLLVNHLGEAILRQIENSKEHLHRSDDLFLHALEFEKDHTNLIHALASVSNGLNEFEIMTQAAKPNEDHKASNSAELSVAAESPVVARALDLAILELNELRTRHIYAEYTAAKAKAKTSTLKNMTLLAAGIGLASSLAIDAAPTLMRITTEILSLIK